MNKDRFFELLDKKAKGLTSPEENREIDAVFEKFQQRGISWKMTAAEDEAIKSRIKRRIEARITEKTPGDGQQLAYWKYAASLVLLIALSLLVFNPFGSDDEVRLVERFTGERQKALVTLQDGSIVHLNINSKIRFPEQFGADSRKIQLEGEAFFEVVADTARPFIVEIEGVQARVLGTSFNVKSADSKEIQVMVKTGKVAVSKEGAQEERQLVLSPRQLAMIDPSNGEMSVSEVDMEEYLAWRSESISFDLLPFSDVMDRLERVYNVRIEIQGNVGQECLIKATYSNRSLYTVLYGLENLVDFDYEKRSDGSILIRYKGCKT